MCEDARGGWRVTSTVRPQSASSWTVHARVEILFVQKGVRIGFNLGDVSPGNQSCGHLSGSLRLGSPLCLLERLRGNNRQCQALLRVRPTIANDSWKSHLVATRLPPTVVSHGSCPTVFWRSAARNSCVAITHLYSVASPETNLNHVIHDHVSCFRFREI